MNILLVNDDGWGAEGLVSLEKIARRLGEVTVIAPEHPQSGISHQLTLHRPMKLKQRAKHSFSLDGTPADCVRVAFDQLETEFDWVLSGINNGANLGTDIFVSGTVAAAREAAILGLNAIAISQHRRRMGEDFNWTYAEHFSSTLIEKLIAESDSDEQHLINVNLPDTTHKSDPLSVKTTECELDLSPLPSVYSNQNGELHYNGNYAQRARQAGQDIDVCFSGNIAVSRLRLG